MYKQYAAYAAALLARSDRFINARSEDMPIYGIDRFGMPVWNNLEYAHKLSILGAIRASADVFGGDIRPLNTLYKLLAHNANSLYEISYIDVTHNQAVTLLLSIAKGS